LKTRFFLPILSVLVVSMLLLAGCSDFDEMKSQRQLMQAETLMQQGQEDEAVQVLTNLLARYSSTQASDVARRHLLRIKKQRERREMMAFAKVLDSYQQVLNGYKSLYAEYPHSVDVLDESGYFFDSLYLADVTPEGYRVYLWLKDDGSGFKAWSTFEGKERGYVVSSESRVLTPFDRDVTLDGLKARFSAASWDSRLVILQPVD